MDWGKFAQDFGTGFAGSFNAAGGNPGGAGIGMNSNANQQQGPVPGIIPTLLRRRRYRSPQDKLNSGIAGAQQKSLGMGPNSGISNAQQQSLYGVPAWQSPAEDDEDQNGDWG